MIDVVKEMLRIEHSDDSNDIFGNAAEFSSNTIQDLKANGHNDALREGLSR